jgi:hypothetical protein
LDKPIVEEACHSVQMYYPVLATSVFGLSAAIVTALGSSPVAAATVFTFATNTTINYSTPPSFTSSGITATLGSPVGTDIPSAALFNTNTAGLCSFINNNNSSSVRRCGSIDQNGGTASTVLSGYSLFFDKPVFLQSFDISTPNNLSSGSIQFASGSSSKLFNFTGDGSQTFDSIFEVAANTEIFVTTSGIFDDSSTSAAFRITNFAVQEVPGPLPVIGALSAFAWSRNLKKKINS